LSIHVFLVLLALGSAAIAVWLAYRYPNVAPTGIKHVLYHIGAAVALSQLTVAALRFTLDPNDPARTVGALFGLALPMLVYCFLVGFWTIKLTQDILGRGAVR
jgi:hypothetical protein